MLQPCHYSCKTCIGPDIDDCLSCTDSISTTHRVAVSSGYCKCETSYYDDGSTVTCLVITFFIRLYFKKKLTKNKFIDFQTQTKT